MAREPIIERLIKLDSCAVSDALDSLNLKGATWGVRPQWQCPKIAGRAVTMKLKPAGLQQPTQHLGTAPIEAALTPDGRPFYAGTYFPPEHRSGMPSFQEVLRAISQVWSQDRQQALDIGDQIIEHLQRTTAWKSPTTEPITLDDLTGFDCGGSRNARPSSPGPGSVSRSRRWRCRWPGRD